MKTNRVFPAVKPVFAGSFLPDLSCDDFIARLI
jgi:hypothetical protein